MAKRILPVYLLLGWVALGTVLYGQTVDEEESEGFRASSPSKVQEGKADVQEAAQLIVEQTNQFRQQQDRQSVETNPNLTDAARYFADYMARTNKYGHTADGQRPAERAREHGYEYCIVTENIAYQYSSAGFTTEALAGMFVEGWKESPGHRKNMLDRDVTETGVAVARSDETGQYYAVQMFGRPKSKSIEFEVANESETAVQYQIGDRQFSLPPGYTRTHQRCRPSEMTFQLPDGEGKMKKVKPDSGDQFVLESQSGQLQLRTRSPARQRSIPKREFSPGTSRG